MSMLYGADGIIYEKKKCSSEDVDEWREDRCPGARILSPWIWIQLLQHQPVGQLGCLQLPALLGQGHRGRSHHLVHDSGG